MLIVVPSLIILFIATLVVLFIKVVGKDDDTHEKRVTKEEHLYKEEDAECC